MEEVGEVRSAELQEESECHGHGSGNNEVDETNAPAHVARNYLSRTVVALTLRPQMPTYELHRQRVEQALQCIAVDVPGKAYIGVDNSLEDAENPVCHRSLGAKHHAEHAEDGRKGGKEIVEFEFAF